MLSLADVIEAAAGIAGEVRAVAGEGDEIRHKMRVGGWTDFSHPEKSKNPRPYGQGCRLAFGSVPGQ